MFGEGYDRRKCEIAEPAYQGINVDPCEIDPIKPEMGQGDHDLAEKEAFEAPVAETAPLLSTALQTEHTTISSVYDTKNQLSSLVKNAQRNKEALEKRNQRIKKAKTESRNRYGW